jgi:predicted RNA-binding Zn-ribbon protein involved in translation (DUF1610 family)
MTSEERREVAARLRKAADFDEWLDVIINNAIFGVFGEVRHPIADTLADLIDPTCHMVDTDHEYEDSIRCDVCQMTFNRPWEPFKFCPNCGARVVTRDADGAR